MREKKAQGGGLVSPTAGEDHVPEKMHGGGKNVVYTKPVYSGHSLGQNQLAPHDYAMKLMV